MSTICINKALTIQGNNAVFDGQGIARFLRITSKNVVLKDITFINSGGYCIYGDRNSGFTLINCTFKNSSNYAIFTGDGSVTIINSSFIDCHSKYTGAVFMQGTT